MHYKEVISSKGAYIETLLSDLNLATRLKHHQMVLDYEVINLVAVVKTVLIDVLNSPRVMLLEHSVTFTHSQDVVLVAMDCHLFKRALTLRMMALGFKKKILTKFFQDTIEVPIHVQLAKEVVLEWLSQRTSLKHIKVQSMQKEVLWMDSKSKSN